MGTMLQSKTLVWYAEPVEISLELEDDKLFSASKGCLLMVKRK